MDGVSLNPISRTWSIQLIIIHFRYIAETINQEREPAQVAPLTSSIGSLFAGIYNMPPPPPTPSLPTSRSTSPAIHIASPIARGGRSSYRLNSPPPGAQSPPPSLNNAQGLSSYSQPYPSTSRAETQSSDLRGSGYQRSTSAPREDSFSFSDQSQIPAAFTYSGGESRARPDGTAGHQSSRSYDSSHRFNPSTAPLSRYGPESSHANGSRDLQYNNGDRGADQY